MPRTDRQLDTERPDRSEERRRARERGGATALTDKELRELDEALGREGENP